MGRLNNSCVYLCGAMENCVEGGIPWRVSVTERLKPFGVRILNPVNKKSALGHESINVRQNMYELINQGDYVDVKRLGKEIRNTDLSMVDDARFLIFYLDLDVLTCGSWEEVFWANRSKKPILTVVKQTKKRTPLWLIWTIEPTHIFDNFDQMFDYLDYINNSPKMENPGRRWVFYEYENA